MAHASRKHVGPGAQGKHDGSGALTEADPDRVPEHMTLSNRDKKQHGEGRGLDGREVMSAPLNDSVANRLPEE